MTRKAATAVTHANPSSRCDPSSVGYADTFSRKGRRKPLAAAIMPMWIAQRASMPA